MISSPKSVQSDTEDIVQRTDLWLYSKTYSSKHSNPSWYCQFSFSTNQYTKVCVLLELKALLTVICIFLWKKIVIAWTQIFYCPCNKVTVTKLNGQISKTWVNANPIGVNQKCGTNWMAIFFYNFRYLRVLQSISIKVSCQKDTVHILRSPIQLGPTTYAKPFPIYLS